MKHYNEPIESYLIIILIKKGSVAKNLAILQNQLKTSQMGDIYML